MRRLKHLHRYLHVRPAVILPGLLPLSLALAAGFTAAAADSPAAVLSPNEREGLFQAYFDRMTEPQPLARFKTREAWFAYRADLRPGILRAIGLSPLPDRVDLSPVITGRLEREGYSVERVYYQVFPRVYASGYLYRPSRPMSPGERLPAVLNPHGHWALGALDPVVQSRCIALAKMGYVAFCPDSTHVADLGVGLCPIGLMTWNNMRALDYLESLDCVDKERIGCTGESGGGQQTLYLAALDERVKVIVPAVLVSYFRRILFASEQTHCFCNHAPGIARLTDEHELAAMFAPRAALFICATGDWTREFPREEFPEIKRIYQLVGGDVDCVQFDKPHNYDRESREQMYAWMNRHLKGDSDPATAREPPVEPEKPDTLKALSGPVPGGLSLEAARDYYRQKYTARNPLPRGKAQWREYQQQTRNALGELLGASPAPAARGFVSRGTAVLGNHRIERILLRSETEVDVPCWLMLPEGQRRKNPALVLAHPKGKEALLLERPELVNRLLQAGVTLLAVDPRWRGELQRNWHWNQVIWGRPEEAMAAHDLNSAGAYLRSRKEVDPRRVFVLGLGEAGRCAICASALDERWAGVAADEIGALYSERDVLQVIPNLLRLGDLPEIAGLSGPRPLWINGARSRFAWTDACYRGQGHAADFHCSDLSPETFDLQFPAWVARAKRASASSP